MTALWRLTSCRNIIKMQRYKWLHDRDLRISTGIRVFEQMRMWQADASRAAAQVWISAIKKRRSRLYLYHKERINFVHNLRVFSRIYRSRYGERGWNGSHQSSKARSSSVRTETRNCSCSVILSLLQLSQTVSFLFYTQETSSIAIKLTYSDSIVCEHAKKMY